VLLVPLTGLGREGGATVVEGRPGRDARSTRTTGRTLHPQALELTVVLVSTAFCLAHGSWTRSHFTDPVAAASTSEALHAGGVGAILAATVPALFAFNCYDWIVTVCLLVAVSAIVSRVRDRDPERPARMPLWPLPPLVAIAGSCWPSPSRPSCTSRRARRERGGPRRGRGVPAVTATAPAARRGDLSARGRLGEAERPGPRRQPGLRASRV
jgi:hypothetical protein